jgi:hypothetical protein
MDAWDKIQAIRAGSRDRENRDTRSYGTALVEESYPHLGQWAQGHWTTENIAECQQLVFDAVQRGSRPLLQVAIYALADFPEVKRTIWAALNDQQQGKIRVMMQILA